MSRVNHRRPYARHSEADGDADAVFPPVAPCGFCSSECYAEPRRITYSEGEFSGVFCCRQCLLDWLALELDVGERRG